LIDDDNICTLDDCDNYYGCQYTNVDCEDKDVCTDDGCDVDSGCYNNPISYDNACIDDIFDAVNGVSHTLVDCDDNNACTVDYYDVESGCESYDFNCDDSNACNTDSCNPDTGCQYENLPIDDNTACTYDYCYPINGVQHWYLAHDECNESCNEQIGCVNIPVDNEDNACTDDDNWLLWLWRMLNHWRWLWWVQCLDNWYLIPTSCFQRLWWKSQLIKTSNPI